MKRISLIAAAVLLMIEPATAAQYPHAYYPHQYRQYQHQYRYRDDCYCQPYYYPRWISVPADRVNRGTATCNGICN